MKTFSGEKSLKFVPDQLLLNTHSTSLDSERPPGSSSSSNSSVFFPHRFLWFFFSQLQSVEPLLSCVGMTNNAAEGGTMRRPSEGLISPAQVHPSAVIAGSGDKRTVSWEGGFTHLSLDSVVNLAFILWTCFLPAGGWSCLCLGSCWFQHHVCGRKALGSVRSMRGRADAWLIPQCIRCQWPYYRLRFLEPCDSALCWPDSHTHQPGPRLWTMKPKFFHINVQLFPSTLPKTQLAAN